LAQKLMGKVVGDTVELDHVSQPGLYELVRLGNALVEEDLHISAPAASGTSS
jgi:hypothetical protein